ncbi:DNA methyltransferase [Streptomyces sp900116325]|uniref:DNA methyltransferase n=1 Tax=Streptomyces sp. 900116325 TaxID=3154295 RepID=UPI0033B46FA5
MSATSTADLSLFPYSQVKPQSFRTSRQLNALPATSPALRLNAICPYYTMFPLRFPLRVLGNATKGQSVIDPFSGRGTTLFAARLLGLECTGIDSSPVAAHLSTAKLSLADPTDVTALAEQALSIPAPSEEVPEGVFWDWAYAPGTLKQICRIRGHLLDPSRLRIRPEHADALNLLRALMMGILHGPQTKRLPSYLSNQMPRTYATKPAAAVRFWEKRTMRPVEVPVLDVVARRSAFTLMDLPPKSAGEVRQGDCREELTSITDGKFDWVVTSPPYFGMRSYVPDQWLRNWFVGGSHDVEYSENGQLGGQRENDFVQSLADVWHKVSQNCAPTAKMVIRFGSLPSLKKDPAALVKASLNESGAWKVSTIKSAGAAPSGRRQADQFSTTGGYVDEVDVWAKKI